MTTGVQQLRITDFDYDLPEERIALYPSPNREASRLLHYANGNIHLWPFTELPSLIPTGSLLVFNETKVIPARIEFQKPSGARIEIFCLEPAEDTGGFLNTPKKMSQVEWYCLIGGASKWKPGSLLEKTLPYNGQTITLKAAFIRKEKDRFLIGFSWTPHTFRFAEILQGAGDIPLPPYIKRKTEANDRERYQTVYAKNEGSVAAPTAGLHFTPEILNALEAKGIDSGFLTLHVGAGTFKPVQSETMEGHPMHAESIFFSMDFLQLLLRHLHGPVVAVGTTALRSLESIYWLGVKAAKKQLSDGATPFLTQWEPYETGTEHLSAAKSIETLIQWMQENSLSALKARTQLLIAPGYTFRLVDKLITNFHQPRSTLLLLIAAFVGEDWKKIYATALEKQFRFLSYGDSSLLEKNTTTQGEIQE